MQDTQVIPFNFDSHEIRTLLIDGQPWFVAGDVASALEYREAEKMTRWLDDDEKGPHNVGTLGGDQRMTVINESGLYSAILRSRKPEAKRFKKWVTAEVLPAIRKTGRYEVDAQRAPEIQPLRAQRWLTTFITHGNQETRLLSMDKCIFSTAEFIDYLHDIDESQMSTPEVLKLTLKLLKQLSNREIDFTRLAL
jgi:prophage antirepressor-like protein